MGRMVGGVRGRRLLRLSQPGRKQAMPMRSLRTYANTERHMGLPLGGVMRAFAELSGEAGRSGAMIHPIEGGMYVNLNTAIHRVKRA